MSRVIQNQHEHARETGCGNVVRSLVVGVSLTFSVLPGPRAQSQQRVSSAFRQLVDKGVPSPPTDPLQQVRKDNTALAVVRSYQLAVGKATWVDLEATGTIIPETLPQGKSATQDATLQILGHRGYRLDVETPKGVISIRMDGGYGAMRPPGVHVIPMNAGDAATGLLAFPQLQDPSFPASNVSLIDRGTVAVDGLHLHRITVEIPWTDLASKEQTRSGVSITDLYFDPTSNLLVKSVNLPQGTDPRLARYIKVVTYGDYQAVGSVQIPFHMVESLNGQLVWTLQLNHAQLNGGISEEVFKF